MNPQGPFDPNNTGPTPTPVIAQKIDADTGPICNVTVDVSEWLSSR